MSLDKPIADLAMTDFQELISAQVREGKTIDYKQSLPGMTGDDKKEFLADVTSFANTIGGHLLFGIKEIGGVPTGIPGISAADADASIQRFESLLRDGVQPRVPGVQIRAVPVTDSTVVITLRIPRSWALPHRVILGGHDKFYGRHAVGKYPLDVPELRALFALSESTAERIRAFRAERIIKIAVDDGPMRLGGGPKTVLHLVPFGAFSPGADFNVSNLAGNLLELPPIKHSSGWSHRHNFDGLVTFSQYRDDENMLGYLQVFRNGCIEAVDAAIIREHEGKKFIPGSYWENALLQSLSVYLKVQKRLGIQPPVVIMLSLITVQGYMMHTGMMFDLDGSKPIDRDLLLVPDLLVEAFDDVDLATTMRPAFDTVWNAAGLSQSYSYDTNGQRKSR